jgi:RNA polymerase sigma-70 factor (ECF subfamily)
MTATAENIQPSHERLPAPALVVHWDDLLPHREFLVHFASRKLQDPALAEDVVHDVFEAVASGRAAFGGRSALRTWLAGILKHKIIDLVRQRSGLDGLNEDLEGEAWQAIECPQLHPDKLAEQRQALRQVLYHITKLPQGLRDVMELRILKEQSSSEVCSALAITENNLFQRLLKARRCLAASMPLALG